MSRGRNTGSLGFCQEFSTELGIEPVVAVAVSVEFEVGMVSDMQLWYYRLLSI
jgi:hypothetical protein